MPPAALIKNLAGRAAMGSAAYAAYPTITQSIAQDPGYVPRPHARVLAAMTAALAGPKALTRPAAVRGAPGTFVSHPSVRAALGTAAIPVGVGAADVYGRKLAPNGAADGLQKFQRRADQVAEAMVTLSNVANGKATAQQQANLTDAANTHVIQPLGAAAKASIPDAVSQAADAARPILADMAKRLGAGGAGAMVGGALAKVLPDVRKPKNTSDAELKAYQARLRLRRLISNLMAAGGGVAGSVAYDRLSR